MPPQWDLEMLKERQGRAISDVTSAKMYKANGCFRLAFIFVEVSEGVYSGDYSSLLKTLNFCSQFSPGVLSSSPVVSSQLSFWLLCTQDRSLFPGGAVLASVFLLYTIS